MFRQIVLVIVCTLIFGKPVSSQPVLLKCCRYCSTGKACGDGCINKNDKCSKPKGCACDGTPPSQDKVKQNPECQGRPANDYVSFTKSRSNQIGVALGLGKPNSGTLEDLMGKAFENAALKSLKLTKNSLNLGGTIPESVESTVIQLRFKSPPFIETYTEPQSLIFEVKNTSARITPSSFSPQIQRYLAYLSGLQQSPRSIPIKYKDFFVPALVLITPTDATISPALMNKATQLGVAIYLSKASESCSKPYGSIKFSDSILTNSEIKFKTRATVPDIIPKSPATVLLR